MFTKKWSRFLLENLLVFPNFPCTERTDFCSRLISVLHSRERARESVWLPGLSKQIEDMVTTCPTCCKYRQNHTEPMIASSLPEAWERLYHCCRLLLPILRSTSLHNTTSEKVVNHLKSFF